MEKLFYLIYYKKIYEEVYINKFKYFRIFVRKLVENDEQSSPGCG